MDTPVLIEVKRLNAEADALLKMERPDSAMEKLKQARKLVNAEMRRVRALRKRLNNS